MGFRKDLKHPPTSVSGIMNVVVGMGFRKDLKHPPTSVSGIVDALGLVTNATRETSPASKSQVLS
jgi:hypothetical protein